MHTSVSLHFLLTFSVSACFGQYLPILSCHYTDAELVSVVYSCLCGLVSGCGKTVVTNFYCFRMVSAHAQQAVRKLCDLSQLSEETP
jgi:hypothetical protein